MIKEIKGIWCTPTYEMTSQNYDRRLVISSEFGVRFFLFADLLLKQSLQFNTTRFR